MKLASQYTAHGQPYRAFSGVTVLELVVVMAILIATSGLLVYNISPEKLQFVGAGGGRSPGQIATLSSMKAMRDCIAGSDGQQGYWDDMARRPSSFPAFYRAKFLFVRPKTNDLESSYRHLTNYNPATKLGWRGPYFQSTGATYPTDGLNNFTADYLPFGEDGGTYPVLLDAWGNPLVVQGPFSPTNTTTWSLNLIKKSRIVSAGPDRILQTSATTNYDSPEESDDILLYIFPQDE